MPAPFSRSMRFLATDRGRRSKLAILIAMIFIGAWLVWFFGARISVYEVSEDARVEVGRVAYRVDAPVTGQVGAVHLALGRNVQAGQVLLELVDRDLRLALVEKRTRVTGLGAEIELLKRQLETAHSTLGAYHSVAGAEIGEADAHRREAALLARLAHEEAERAERLFQAGLVSAADVARRRIEEEARGALAKGSEQTVDRVEAEGRARRSDLAGAVARLSERSWSSSKELGGPRKRPSTRSDTISIYGTARPSPNRRDRGAPGGFRPQSGRPDRPHRTSRRSARGREVLGRQRQRACPSRSARAAASLQLPMAAVRHPLGDGRERRKRGARRPLASGARHPSGSAFLASLCSTGSTGTVEVEIERVSPAVLVLRTAGRRLRSPA